MSFQIATKAAPKSDPFYVKGEHRISYAGRGEHAERKHRQIIEEIQCCDMPNDVDDVIHEHDEILEDFAVNYPDYLYAIQEAADEWKAMLRPQAQASEASENAPPETNSDNKGKAMFNLPTSTGGEVGPFLNYKQRAGQGMNDGTWYLRDKDGEQTVYADMTEAFKRGFIADVFAAHDGSLGGSLKMGFVWFHEGQAPDRHWFASPLVAEQRRDETKNAQGGYNWQNAVQFRMAIGDGKSALFDVSGWGGYKGVMGMLDLMNAGFEANLGKCPLVQYTGFRVEGTGQKRLHVPEFVIANWVDHPDCLKPETPAISTATPEPAPQPQPAPAPAPAPQAQPAPATAAGF